jgi:hypothetical protein
MVRSWEFSLISLAVKMAFYSTYQMAFIVKKFLKSESVLEGGRG